MPYKPHPDPEDYIPKGDWSKYKRQIYEKLDPIFPGLLDELEAPAEDNSMEDKRRIELLEKENERLRKVQAIMLNAVMSTTDEFHRTMTTLVSSGLGLSDEGKR